MEQQQKNKDYISNPYCNLYTLPAILPDQHFIRSRSYKVFAISIAAADQASIGVANQIAIFIIQVRILIAALWRKIIYFLTVISILIYAVGRVALRFIF